MRRITGPEDYAYNGNDENDNHDDNDDDDDDDDEDDNDDDGDDNNDDDDDDDENDNECNDNAYHNVWKALYGDCYDPKMTMKKQSRLQHRELDESITSLESQAEFTWCR